MYLYRPYNEHTIHTSRSVIPIPYNLLDPTHTSRLHVLIDQLYVYDKYDVCSFIDLE